MYRPAPVPVCLLAGHLAQVVDEGPGDAVVEGTSTERSGLFDRFERGLVAHVPYAIARTLNRPGTRRAYGSSSAM